MHTFKKVTLVTVIFSLLFLISCSKAKEKSPLPPEQGKNTALDFKLKDLNGKEFTLSAYKGKQPVMLFFWTTWCPYCRRELQILNSLYPRLQQEGIEALAIDIGEPASRVERFAKALGIIVPVLLDSAQTTARDYGVMGIPTFVFVDKEGVAVFQDNFFPVADYKEIISK
jgi:peroxiredoxin